MFLNGLLHGYIEAKRADGRIFQGECKQGKFDGKGKYVYPSGEIYEGDFAKGMPEGNGVQIYSDGRRYEGEFKQGIPHGEGQILTKDEYGETEFGCEFKDGIAKGVYFSINKTKESFGLIENGTANGFGYIITKSIANPRIKSIYQGEIKSWKQHGFGVMEWENGRKYEGIWKEGKKNGLGFERLGLDSKEMLKKYHMDVVEFI